jgi:membrane protein DedA with SNARE-associated domain
MFALAVGLIVSTLVSEDLACIATGALIARGDVSALLGVGACACGIFLGDCGLFAIGRLAGHADRLWPRLAHCLARASPAESRRWLDRHAGGAIVASRFMPGTRLPTFLTAGLVRMSPWRFAAWAFAASLLWTPTIVLASARTGNAASSFATGGRWSCLVAAGSALLITRGGRILSASGVRHRLTIRFRRLLRWEFWPAWLFYAPVTLWVLILSFRYRGLTTITASNPGIADGGLVGESKFDILQQLPATHTIPSARLDDDGDRVHRALAVMKREHWVFPIVLKPDVGQRGVGVRLIRSVDQLVAYLSSARGNTLMQPFHEGPYEAGVFYYRFPGQRRGRILSITDKQFPVLVGDGRSTVAELIDAHPRYRLQRTVFLHRHAAVADVVLAAGEGLQLAVAGNHAQGTVFRDGAHLLTPELERRIDEIAGSVPGFFIGRFDIRYRDVEAFKAGHDLAIVELNGASAESTNIYDPDTPLLAAYRTLFQQWSLVFAIGAANRDRGAVPTPLPRLARLVVSHLTTAAPHPVSD